MTNPPLGKLDHIAVAVRSVDQARGFFEGVLGARFLFDAARPEDGFRVLNFDLQGTIIELIEPLGEDSFVQRFIDRRGEGLHHVTFATADARRAAEALKAQGIRVVDEHEWSADSYEAFISPRSAHGVLIQFGSGYPTLSRDSKWSRG
jgi:methylmalonyl-CoA epimerase